MYKLNTKQIIDDVEAISGRWIIGPALLELEKQWNDPEQKKRLIEEYGKQLESFIEMYQVKDGKTS